MFKGKIVRIDKITGIPHLHPIIKLKLIPYGPWTSEVPIYAFPTEDTIIRTFEALKVPFNGLSDLLNYDVEFEQDCKLLIITVNELRCAIVCLDIKEQFIAQTKK